jgi:hypothetical protein
MEQYKAWYSLAWLHFLILTVYEFRADNEISSPHSAKLFNNFTKIIELSLSDKLMHEQLQTTYTI